MIRGGAYGRTGNAFLVVQARELRESEEDDPETLEKANRLVEDWIAWREEVEVRKSRGLDGGECGEGLVWTCPKTSINIGVINLMINILTSICYSKGFRLVERNARFYEKSAGGSNPWKFRI